MSEAPREPEDDDAGVPDAETAYEKRHADSLEAREILKRRLDDQIAKLERDEAQ